MKVNILNGETLSFCLVFRIMIIRIIVVKVGNYGFFFKEMEFLKEWCLEVFGEMVRFVLSYFVVRFINI